MSLIKNLFIDPLQQIMTGSSEGGFETI